MKTDRDETIKRIKSALQRRSVNSWSVTGGRGTAWGWITIQSPPARRTWSHRLKAGAVEAYDTGKPGGSMSPQDREELGELMGLGKPSDCQGISIASSSDYYQEHIDRAEGRTPTKIAQPYWD